MTKQQVVLIPGDGIGPEITAATRHVLDALHPPLTLLEMPAGEAAVATGQPLLPETTLAAIAKHGVCLKGPLTTPVGGGYRSLNVTLRNHFALYANLRPARSFPGTRSRYDDLDLVTVRENTEGMYAGEGRRFDEGVPEERAETISTVSRRGSARVVRFAFEHARAQGRQKVTAVHKANILKATSGLFLETAREVAADYPDIEFEEMIVDATCMQLVLNPHRFDVIVTTNLFGDIISDLCAGLVGGLGMAPGANIGKDAAIFEAVHGSAPDIAGRGLANPTALMLAAAMLLEYIDAVEAAKLLRRALRATLVARDRLTPDLGGRHTTMEFAEAVADRVA